MRSRVTVVRGGIELELQEERLTVGPDGRRQPTGDEPHEPTFRGGTPPFADAILDGAVSDTFRSATSTVAAHHAHPTDGGLSLIVPQDWTPPVAAGRVELGLGDDWRLLDSNVLGVLLAHLKNNDRLDEASAPPDLDRWSRRAARRAGLDDVPERGTPEHARFHEVWSELTQRDRAAPGRDGRVAAWRFQTEGEWWLPGEECALIAAELRTPEWMREALSGLDAGLPLRVGPCT